jgi:hypothetical protein
MSIPTNQQLVDQLVAAIRGIAAAQESWPPHWSFCTSVLALVISVLSICVASFADGEARRIKLRPIMVFFRGPQLTWILKNVGEGTANQVSILNYISPGNLANELQLYPVGPGQEIRLDYLKSGGDKLVATYANIYDRDPHHTACSQDSNKIKKRSYRYTPGPNFTRGHESDTQQWPVTRL